MVLQTVCPSKEPCSKHDAYFSSAKFRTHKWLEGISLGIPEVVPDEWMMNAVARSSTAGKDPRVGKSSPRGSNECISAIVKDGIVGTGDVASASL